MRIDARRGRARPADAAGRSPRDRRFRAGRRLQRRGTAAPAAPRRRSSTVKLDLTHADARRHRAACPPIRRRRLQALCPFGAVLAAGRRGAARRDVEGRAAAAMSAGAEPSAQIRTDCVDAAVNHAAVRIAAAKGNRKVPRIKSPRGRHSISRSPRASAARPNRAGQGDRRSMQVRPITDTPRKRYRFWRRLLLFVLRWTFIVIGALAVRLGRCSPISIASTRRSTIRRCSRSASAACSRCCAASC